MAGFQQDCVTLAQMIHYNFNNHRITHITYIINKQT